jgi:phage-related protein
MRGRTFMLCSYRNEMQLAKLESDSSRRQTEVDCLYQNGYTRCLKPVSFLGNSLVAVRAFPDGARREAGFQIDRLQRGLDPDDWKPMPFVGPGAREIQVRDASGAWRVIYVATFEEAVYVLHAFGKTTQATSKRDVELATTRFKELMRRERR